MSTQTQPLYRMIASALHAARSCKEIGNKEWENIHTERVHDLVKQFLPSGSGFDNGTHIYWSSSTPEKLVFGAMFHHMDKCGGYDGWTEHFVTVRASLVFGLTISVSGRNRNDIKEHIHDCFSHALNQSIEWAFTDGKDGYRIASTKEGAQA